MSSRILSGAADTGILPLEWRAAGSGTQGLPSAPEQGGLDPLRRRGEDAGPGWDQYRALETKIRELQHEMLQREQEARASGRNEGERAAAAQWGPAIERLTRTTAEIASLRGRLRREAEQDVVRLSIALAKRILRRELTIDPEALLGLVKVALERVDLRETHRIRVRAEDVALVKGYLERIGSPQRVEVLADNTLERGGAVFETERGNLDASVETQLEEIVRGFADRLARPGDVG